MQQFQTTALFSELFENINVGYPGCFGVKRELEWENHLALYTQKRRAIITDFAVSFWTASGKQIRFGRDDFQGILLLDNRGERPNRVRILLLDEDGTLLLASDCERLYGQVIIVGDQAISAEPKLFGVKAAFCEGEEGASSTMLWDGSKQLTKLWTMEAQLLGQAGGVTHGSAIHL